MQHKVIAVLNTGKVHCPGLQEYKTCNICIKKLSICFQQFFCKFSAENPELNTPATSPLSHGDWAAAMAGVWMSVTTV